jgi:heterodisulfide reductase subunit C
VAPHQDLARFQTKTLTKISRLSKRLNLCEKTAGAVGGVTKITTGCFLKIKGQEVFMGNAKQSPLRVDPGFSSLVQASASLKVNACFQCRKCTNGCPVTFAMDIYPDEVIRLVLLGQKERVLKCSTIWVCSACETCTTRCPNEVDIAGTMDALKEMAVKEGIEIPQPKTYAFHKAFLDDVKKRGRMFEGKLMQSYLIHSGELFRKLLDGSIKDEVSLGLSMFKKGRLPLLPKGIKEKKEIKKILK